MEGMLKETLEENFLQPYRDMDFFQKEPKFFQKGNHQKYI